MPTVFSHIVQKLLSQESENVATTALAFILEPKKGARNGLMKLLRGVVPEMPDLWFRTQQTEDSSRPDMWGNDGEAKPHVFIENKFWAGLTENQPVSYLRILAKQNHPTVLLVVVPEAREQTVWRELSQRLESNEITSTDREASAGVVRSIKTSIGPILALTSWAKLLSFLELEDTDDKAARSNLFQLRSLCEEVDSAAFVPFSSEYISDQRFPAHILQLIFIVKTSVEQGITEKVLNTRGIGGNWTALRIGRYANCGDGKDIGLWFGIDFRLWKEHGGTPLWVAFKSGDWGHHASEVRELLEPWAAQNKVFTASGENDFVVAIDIPVREEEKTVVRAIVNRLKEIGDILSVLKPRATGDSGSIGKPLEDLIPSEPAAP